MKILMLTPYLPFPPSSGGEIRSYNLIKHLSKKHKITLFSLIKNDSEKKNIPELTKYYKKVKVFKRSKKPFTLKNILRTGFSTYPFLVIRNLVPEEKSAVERELRENEYDLIHAETFYVMPNIPKTKIPVLLVDQTIEYLVYKHYVTTEAPQIARPLFSIDVAKLKYWEKEYWEKAQKVVAVSNEDSKQMRKLSPSLDVGVVPNGVNLELFKPKSNWDLKNPVLLFFANFAWMQNTEAALILIKLIFPQILKEVPGAKLRIVGQHIPELIKFAATKNVILESLGEDSEMRIGKIYFDASVFISPLEGPGGTRLKHLAAMASKLPIITTRVGAQGIGVKDGVSAIVRDKPTEIAEETIKLLNDPKQVMLIADKARKLAVEKYSWEIMAKKLDGIYKEVGGKA